MRSACPILREVSCICTHADKQMHVHRTIAIVAGPYKQFSNSCFGEVLDPYRTSTRECTISHQHLIHCLGDKHKQMIRSWGDKYAYIYMHAHQARPACLVLVLWGALATSVQLGHMCHEIAMNQCASVEQADDSCKHASGKLP